MQVLYVYMYVYVCVCMYVCIWSGNVLLLYTLDVFVSETDRRTRCVTCVGSVRPAFHMHSCMNA